MMSRGLSSVYGFIVIYLVTIAALQASSTAIGSLVSLQASHDRAYQLESMQKIEHLTVTLGSGGNLTITNDGSVASTLRYLHLTFASSSSDIPLNQKLAVGQTLQLTVKTANAISAVTSLGNIFWASSPAPVSGSGKYAVVVFDTTGIPAGATQVLTVDGTSYAINQLPLTFNWASGEFHTYAYVAGVPSGNGTRIGWSDTRGLSTSRTGQITVQQSGNLVADYQTQYFLTLVGGGNIQTTPTSPTGDNWFNSGTTVYATTDDVWGVVPGQSRSDLVSWSVDAATPTAVPRSGTGSFTTGGVVMNAPHTLTLNSASQYYLSLGSVISSSGTVPALTFGYSYVTPYSVGQILINPGFESGSVSPWTSATNCYYPGNVVTSPVHSGSYAYHIDGVGQPAPFNCWGASQVVSLSSLPAGAVVTSISASLWLYDSGNGDSAYLSVTPAASTCWARTQVALSAGTWTRLTTSVSGCAILQPSSIQLQADLIAGCVTYKGTVVYCGDGYVDDGTLSITYSVTSASSVASGINSYSASGSTVTYTYSAAASFPAGTVNKQLQTTLPGMETLSQILIGSGPNVLPPSAYSVSGAQVTIPDGTIAAYGGTFTLVTTASGAYSVSQSGSITGDDWYDSNAVATISASANSPFRFSYWTGSSTIANPNSAQTTVVMNSYFSLAANLGVLP